MSERANALVNIKKLERRATRTLIAWWGTFNAWKWPAGFGPDEGQPQPGQCIRDSRRMAYMDAIQMELGRRMLHKHRYGTGAR